MGTSEPSGHEEPHAGVGALTLVRTTELAEDHPGCFIGHTWPSVGHDEPHAVWTRLESDGHRFSARAEAQCVVEQVLHDLRDPVRVEVDHDGSRGQRELDVGTIAVAAELDDDPVHEADEVRWCPHKGDRPRRDIPGVLQQLEDAQDATIVVVGTTIRFANPAAAELLAAPDAAALVGRSFFELIAPASMGAAVERYEGVQRGRWARPEAVWLRRIDGAQVLVGVTSSPVRWEGELASQATMWELAGGGTRLREVVTGFRTEVADAVVITDPERLILSLNPAAEALYGWREDEVVGRPVQEVLPWLGSDVDLVRAREVLMEDGRWHGEVEQAMRDGSRIQVGLSVSLVRDDAGQAIAFVSVNRPKMQVDTHVSPGRDRSERDDATIAEALRQGIDRGELVVHYQLLVDLEGGGHRGVEALVRWQHPTRGLLAPGAFIAAAERSGAIVELGEHVLDVACRQAQLWRRAGHDLHLSVNLSARQLTDEHLPDRIAEVMAATDMPAGRFWLEVTETALVLDILQAQKVLHEIHELGACITIDDFGTGWASLTYLREFPVSLLKIDGSFVQGLGKRRSDTAIVRSILALGRELELQVIAEGIETEDQRAHLLRLGCELGQGYLFGRPVPADELQLSP